MEHLLQPRSICIQAGPTCFRPTALSANATGSTTGELSWTADGTNNVDYEIVVVAQGDPVTGTVVATAVNVQSPFSVAGLTASTDYDFYVRANCGAGDLSSYSGPVSFTTSPLCGSTTFDSGGAMGDYSINEEYTITFYPDSAANVAQLEFLFVDLEELFGGNGFFDDISIYDGIDINAPLIIEEVPLVDVAGNGDAPLIYTATGPTGALTLEFDSDGSTNAGGFEVIFNCILRPTCLPPSALAVDAVTNTTADLSWTAGTSMETIWDVEVVLQVICQREHQLIRCCNPYTKTGLTPGTRYEYYLRADCVNATSSYVGPFAFRTSGDGDTCDTPISLPVNTVCDATTQQSIDFENALDLGNNIASCSSNGANSGQWFTFRPARNNPAVYISSSEQVQYALFSDDCTTTDIYCGTIDANDRVELINLDFRVFYKLVIWDDSNSLVSTNICVQEGPSCSTPLNLGVSNFTTTTAELNWTPGDISQNSFTAELYNAGDDPTDPTVTAVYSEVVTTPSATATGLVIGTSYDFYVQADCDIANPGTDVSTITGPFTFTLDAAGESCNAAIRRTVEVDCATSTPYTIDFTTAANLGAVSDCDTSGVNTGAWLDFIAPANGAVQVSMSLSMKYAIFDNCNSDQLFCRNTATLSSGTLGGLVAGNVYKIALWKDGQTTGTSDICISEVVGCIEPLNITADNITATDADISFTPGDLTQTAFEVELVLDGDPQTGTNIFTGGMSPIQVTGLLPITDYDVYVRADCGNGDFSSWTGPISFTTPCAVFTPDYVTGFNTYLPDCWSEAGDGDAVNADQIQPLQLLDG